MKHHTVIDAVSGFYFAYTTFIVSDRNSND